jgi:hypothetical protein
VQRLVLLLLVFLAISSEGKFAGDNPVVLFVSF